MYLLCSCRCPMESPIKKRMVFSTSKGSLIQFIEKYIILQRKVEVDSIAEVADNVICDHVEPVIVKQSGFKKPQRPGRK